MCNTLESINYDLRLTIVLLQYEFMNHHKKLPTKDELFDLWFYKECKSGNLFVEYDYNYPENQQKQSFHDWAKTKFSNMIESHNINVNSFDIDRFLDNRR